MEPPDLVGLPVTTGKRTEYLPPSFLPSGGKGILLFEELNRCERFMRAPCLQLITARELNDYKLPPGWIPAAAINPSGDDYEVDELDPALLSRFVKAEIFADVEEWLIWAKSHGIDPSVTNYIRHNPDALCDGEANPRAWEIASSFVGPAGGKSLLPEAKAAIRGAVGNVQANAFIKTLEDSTGPLDAKSLLSGYSREGRVRDWVKTGRLDLVQGTLRGLKVYLQSPRNFKAVRGSGARWKNLQEFVSDLPGDLRTDFQEFCCSQGCEVPKPRRRAGRKAK
jgi:hypothetical protein